MARPGLEKHVKFRRLVRMLGEPIPHVRGYLECLWEVAYETGNPVIGDDYQIEAAAQYPGLHRKLFEALRDCGGTGHVGFIEPTGHNPQIFQIHDLYDHAPEYVKKRLKRENERKSNGDGENGGQRRTVDDNGAPPAPSTQHPHPAPAPKKQQQLAGAFGEISETDLAEPQAVDSWQLRQSKKRKPVVHYSTDERVKVQAAAVKCSHPDTVIDSRMALFADIVGNRNWSYLRNADIDAGAERLRAIEALQRPPPRADREFAVRASINRAEP